MAPTPQLGREQIAGPPRVVAGEDAADRRGVGLGGAQRPGCSVAIERASRLNPLELRTLDAIHLDAALELRGAGAITGILTHDRNGDDLITPGGGNGRSLLDESSHRAAMTGFRAGCRP